MNSGDPEWPKNQLTCPTNYIQKIKKNSNWFVHYSYFDKSGSNSYSHKVLQRQVRYLPRDILTSAIEVVCNGVQEGVLWSEEALHHRHLVLDEPKAADSQAAVSRSSSTSPKEGLEGKPWCLSMGLLLTPGQCGDSVGCFYSALSR